MAGSVGAGYRRLVSRWFQWPMIGGTYDSRSADGFPDSTFSTMELAISSASSGYFSKAAVKAASASGRRPRWSSATA